MSVIIVILGMKYSIKKRRKKMTNEKMFEEIGCPDELKKCKDEIKRHKKHIEKLSNQLLDYERLIEEKDNEIIIIKNR
jgi:hypothetical protein